MFSYELLEIFQNTYFIKRLWRAASENDKLKINYHICL